MAGETPFDRLKTLGWTDAEASDAINVATNAAMDAGQNTGQFPTADIIWSFVLQAHPELQGGTHMAQLVPGGAIEKYVQANGLTALSDEVTEIGDQVAKAYTDKGLVVWTKVDGVARLLPFA